MAAREKQMYLVVVIGLSLLSLSLALVAFFGLKNANERTAAAEAKRVAADAERLDTEAKLKAALLIADAQTLKGEAYKSLIGNLGVAPSEINKTIIDLQKVSTDPALSDLDREIAQNIVNEVKTARKTCKTAVNQATANLGDPEVLAIHGNSEDSPTLLNRITDLSALANRLRMDYSIQVRSADETARRFKLQLAEARAAVKGE